MPPLLMDPLRLEAPDNHDNQPATGAMKTGGGWQKSIDKATTRPRQWATTNNKGMRRMVMAVTKRARMARAMVTAMRVPINEEGEGGTGHGIGNKGGVRQRGQGRRRQEQWQQGWQASDGNKGNGNRRQTTINQRWDRQRRAVAGERALMRQPHDHDGGRRRTTRACGR